MLTNNENNSTDIDDERSALTKSILVSELKAKQEQLSESDVDLAVNCILNSMSTSLTKGNRIEIRGFGSLTLHYRRARIGRNPKTGQDTQVAEKYVPHFKPGAILRSRVNNKK